MVNVSDNLAGYRLKVFIHASIMCSEAYIGVSSVQHYTIFFQLRRANYLQRVAEFVGVLDLTTCAHAIYWQLAMNRPGFRRD